MTLGLEQTMSCSQPSRYQGVPSCHSVPSQKAAVDPDPFLPAHTLAQANLGHTSLQASLKQLLQLTFTGDKSRVQTIITLC